MEKKDIVEDTVQENHCSCLFKSSCANSDGFACVVSVRKPPVAKQKSPKSTSTAVMPARPSVRSIDGEKDEWVKSPSANMELDKAVKFDDWIFGEAEEGKRRKGLPVYEERDYCATPPFAYAVTRDDLVNLVQNLRKTGNAELFCDALESNDCQPCTNFETSCSRKINSDKFSHNK